jgi:hypothetical protein
LAHHFAPNSRVVAALDLHQGWHSILVDEEMRPSGRSAGLAGDWLFTVDQKEPSRVGAINLIAGQEGRELR